MALSFELLSRKITRCSKCARLTAHCRQVAVVKKKAYREWKYWGRPVSGFGDPKARLWIVGLAPAAHGANRTGRMFTGDSSGDWLYRALFETGFANQPHSSHNEDGLRLTGAYISAAVRCAPPDNRPSPLELQQCAPYLAQEFSLLTERRLILALGQIAFNAVVQLIENHSQERFRPRPRFGHSKQHSLAGHLVLCSYHPSRQNTQTGRLRWDPWRRIFDEAVTLIG